MGRADGLGSDMAGIIAFPRAGDKEKKQAKRSCEQFVEKVLYCHCEERFLRRGNLTVID